MSQFVSTYSPSILIKTGNKQEKLAYREYLQSQNFVKEITDSTAKVQYGVSENSREIIATLDQLEDAQFEVVDAVQDVADSVRDVGEAMKHGFNVIAYQLEDISEGVTELNATCHWGFSRMIADIGQVNDSLRELISINKNPVQTRAYNKFEIARDALRRELYPEAVEALEQAINGYGGETGYKLEYRFHYTLGLLHLGDVKNTDPTILDLAKAENDFLTAARYAKTDFPMEAGVAFTAASWAAYCQGRLSEAQSYAEQAIQIHQKNGEAFFQLAKVLMFRDEPEKALEHLFTAVLLDRNYMLKAAADVDFLKYEEKMNVTFNQLRKGTGIIFKTLLSTTEEQVRKMLEWRTRDSFSDDTEKVVELVTAAQNEALTDTYFGYDNACELARQAKALAPDVLQRHQQQIKKTYQNRAESLTNLQQSVKSVAESFSPTAFHEASTRLRATAALSRFRTQADCDANFQTLDDLENSFRGADKTGQAKIESRKTSAATDGLVIGSIRGGIVGILTGTVVGFIAAIIVTIIVGFFHWVITGLMTTGGDDSFRKHDYGAIAGLVTFFGCVIGGLIIGAKNDGNSLAEKWKSEEDQRIKEKMRGH